MHHELYSDTNYIWTHTYPKNIEKGAKTPVTASISRPKQRQAYIQKKFPQFVRTKGTREKSGDDLLSHN